MKQINLFLELKGRGDKDIKSIPKHENLRLQNSFLVDNNQEFITFLYREAVENDSLFCYTRALFSFAEAETQAEVEIEIQRALFVD